MQLMKPDLGSSWALRWVFLVLTGLMACGSETPGPARKPADEGSLEAEARKEVALPSVLILTVDTLRPDYMSMNGYDRPTTPYLDSLLADGFYFEQAVTPIPRTTPALASLLTGAYPHTTGLRTLTDTLSFAVLSVTEVIRTLGYQTFAVMANNIIRPKRGLARGFDIYQVAHASHTARDITDAAVAFVQTRDPAKPFFSWIHYMDPHVPYHPDATFAEAFDPGYGDRYRLNFGELPNRDEPGRMPEPGKRLEGFYVFPQGLPKREATLRNPLPGRVNEHIRRLYAADIRSLDEEMSRLIEAFREQSSGNLVVIFAADHGESLGEHDFYYDHGDFVYGASMRIPLAIILPPTHPLHGSGRCRGWVSLIDIVPTLFDLLGREVPAIMRGQVEGRSLASCMTEGVLAKRPTYGESGRSYYPRYVPRRKQNNVAGRFRAVIDGDWKVIWTPFQPDEQAWELYNLHEDPEETRNLYRPDHPEFTRLQELLADWFHNGKRSQGTPPPAPLSEADRNALRALGYID